MQELHNKTDHDLNKELGDKREMLRKFRFDVSGSKIKNVKEARSLRKGIARILTVVEMRKISSRKHSKK